MGKFSSQYSEVSVDIARSDARAALAFANSLSLMSSFTSLLKVVAVNVTSTQDGTNGGNDSGADLYSFFATSLLDHDCVGLCGGESDGSRNFLRMTPGVGRWIARVAGARAEFWLFGGGGPNGRGGTHLMGEG